jgi:hypothetical protein
MITKEDAIAISNGDIEWHVAVAKAHAVRIHEAQKTEDMNHRRVCFDEWFRFLNSLSEPAKWRAYSAFGRVLNEASK